MITEHMLNKAVQTFGNHISYVTVDMYGNVYAHKEKPLRKGNIWYSPNMQKYMSINLTSDEAIHAYRAIATIPPVKEAKDFLQEAINVMTERGKQYDSEERERSMGKCVEAFNVITGKDLTESEGWLLLQLLKDVRQWSKKTYHEDSALDCIAYSALKAEALNQGK